MNSSLQLAEFNPSMVLGSQFSFHDTHLPASTDVTRLEQAFRANHENNTLEDLLYHGALVKVDRITGMKRRQNGTTSGLSFIDPVHLWSLLQQQDQPFLRSLHTLQSGVTHVEALGRLLISVIDDRDQLVSLCAVRNSRNGVWKVGFKPMEEERMLGQYALHFGETR